MARDSVGKRESRLRSRSIDDAPLPGAENEVDVSIQTDLVELMRLVGGYIKSIRFEAQVAKSLLGYGRKRRYDALGIDLQHLVVPEIDDVEISSVIERNAVWALEEIAFCECRHRAIRRNSRDRIAAAVCHVHIAALVVDRYADRAAQAAGHEGFGLTFSIDPGD